MPIVQAEEAVEQAARAGKAERRDEEGRQQIVPHQQVHEPDGDRVSGQEDELHQPVPGCVLVGKNAALNEPRHVGGADVAVTRDVKVVVAVGVGPVVERLVIALAAALGEAYQPDEQGHAYAE